MSSLLSCTGLSPSLAGFPKTVPLLSGVASAVRTPVCSHTGLGSSHFARRYFGNRCFFLLLRLLRCFSSPGSPPYVIAAYHVFHRLLVPRHPPCALSCLASSDTIALISDGLLFLGFSTCPLLSQRLVSSLSLRLTYFRCFVYAVFKVHI